MNCRQVATARVRRKTNQSRQAATLGPLLTALACRRPSQRGTILGGRVVGSFAALCSGSMFNTHG